MMGSLILPAPSGNLGIQMQGVWWLLSREDWTKDNRRKIDLALGSDPIGILSYAVTHFAAQFMKSNRSDHPLPEMSHSGQNNAGAIGGYDAYFGTYEVNEQTGKVAHTLIGSITLSNIGMTVFRDLRVNNDQLIIQLETTTPENESITRTLIWKRVSQKNALSE